MSPSMQAARRCDTAQDCQDCEPVSLTVDSGLSFAAAIASSTPPLCSKTISLPSGGRCVPSSLTAYPQAPVCKRSVGLSHNRSSLVMWTAHRHLSASVPLVYHTSAARFCWQQAPQGRGVRHH